MADTKVIVIPEGKICDYIDGKFRNDTPEEAFTCCSEHNAHNPGTGCGHKECHFYRNNP